MSAGRADLGTSVIQPARVIADAWTVARFGDPSRPEDPPDDPRSIRQPYLDSLNRIQNHRFPEAMAGDEIALDFGDGSDAEAALRELLAVDRLPEGWRYSAVEEDRIREDAAEAIRSIAELSPPLHMGMQLIVAGFIFARSPEMEGGSTSVLMGPIWLGPSPAWSPATYVENMIHEYVHQCLFLDEMVNTIFTEFSVPRMSTADALVTSTILKRRRPYDKAYHSAFVAHLLAQYYIGQGDTSKARDYLRSTRRTVDELLERRQYASPNGEALLEELSESVDVHLVMTV